MGEGIKDEDEMTLIITETIIIVNVNYKQVMFLDMGSLIYFKERSYSTSINTVALATDKSPVPKAAFIVEHMCIHMCAHTHTRKCGKKRKLKVHNNSQL